MKRMRWEIFGIAVAGIAAGSAGEPARLEGSWGELHGQPLVPAVLGIWTDQTGSAWNLQDHAVLGRIGSGMMNAGQALTVAGENFACDAPLMTRDGGEWVFPGNRLLSGLAVTRRVRLDRALGTVRYLETLRNPSAMAVSVTVELRSQYNGTIDRWTSDRGTLAPVTLGEDEGGIVIVPGTAGHDRLWIHALCSGRCQSSPALAVPSRFAFLARYQVSVPPGGSAILLHGLAQRLPDAPANLDLARWGEALTPRERQDVVNLPSPREDDVRVRWLAAAAAEWGIVPAVDTLFLEGKSHLAGELRAETIALQTRWGRVSWGLAELAGLEIGAEGGARVLLRNGEVWRGRLIDGGAVFAPASGVGEIALDGSRAVRCARGGAVLTDTWPSGVDGFLETQEGERMALRSLSSTTAGFTSPWGNWSGTLDDVQAFEWRDAEPWLRRQDGTSVRAFALEDSWKVRTLVAGEVSLPVQQIRRFVHGGLAKGGATGVEVRLGNGERLSADWSETAIEVQGLSVAPSAIRELRRGAGAGIVRIWLWDGGEVEGALSGGGLPIKVGGKEFRVSLGDLESAVSGRALLTETERAAIAADIVKLGDAQWREREAASQRLAGLGARARGELEGALAFGKWEPEVRHRLQCLLEKP